MCALIGVASRPASAQTYILNEAFTQTATPTTATPIVRVVGGYIGPGGVTYTADAYWANQDCNGLLSSWNQSSTDIGGLPGAQCGMPASNRYGWAFSQQLAQALGQLNGQTQAQARNNFAVSAYTLSSSAAAGGIELQSSQVPMNPPAGGTGRFVMFSVDVAASNCTAAGNPLLQFYLLNAANVQTAVGGQINACALTTTFPTEARGTLPAASHRAGRYPTSAAILHLGTTVAVRLRNQTVFANGDGNDHAFDNIRIIDATPTVSKAFGSATTVVGQPATLTFTVTNTPDNLQKQGWSFIDTLPTGLVVATPNGVSTTCTGSTVLAVAGTGLISVSNGNLPAGATCAITVNVVSQTLGTYTNGASNIAPSTGLNLPPTPATLTVVPPTLLRLQKELPGGRVQAPDQFTLSIAGTGAPAAVTTTGSGTTATGLVTHANATPGSSYTLSEAAAGGAVLTTYATTYTCTNARAGGQTPSGSTATFNVVPVVGDDLTCTFRNAARPRMTIRKTSVNGTGSFPFTGSNGIANQTLVTSTAGTPVSGTVQTLTAIGTATTITEGTLPANYQLTDITCTGLPTGGTATPNLATRQVVLNAAATVAGANVVCTFTNTLLQTDVRVQKTATPNPTQSGGVVTYTIVVNNDGPAAAHGTVLTDTPGAGLNCTAPSTTLVCTATGGATCPSGTVPVSTLTGSGMTIPTLPAGGQVTATVQCTVTATGLP